MSDEIHFLGQDAHGNIYAVVGTAAHPFAVRGRLGLRFKSVPMLEWGPDHPSFGTAGVEQAFIELKDEGVVPLTGLDPIYYTVRDGKINRLKPGSYQLSHNVLTDMFDDWGLKDPKGSATKALDVLRKSGLPLPANTIR